MTARVKVPAVVPASCLRRRGVRAVSFIVLALSLTRGASAQSSALGPDSVAAEFQAALRGVGWRAAVSRLHPEALADFHYRMTLLVEMDTTRAPLEKLYPSGGLDTYHATSPEGVFLRVMEVLSEEAPGLVHALVVREVEVIGHVQEGPNLAHVVYRSTADLSGAEPELRLMTMKKDGDRWRVLDSQELDILVEAFRGISRRRGPPPGGWPADVPPDTGWVAPGLRSSGDIHTPLPPPGRR
jgi:hypothetical protein